MRKTTTSWKPGSSGNPKGRPKGCGFAGKLRTKIAGDVPDIVDALTKMAKAGDPQAARILLDRVVAPLKPQEVAAPISLPDGPAAEQGAAVIRAIAAGDLAPGQGAVLLQAVANLARVVDLADLERRIAALEKGHEGTV